MTTGTSSYEGLAVGLFGEHEITQVTGGTDMLTLTSADTTSTAALLVIQDSDAAPATQGFRFYPYGRFRIIRNDDEAIGGGYKNCIDAKLVLSYDCGAVAHSVFVASFILDTSSGSAGQTGGREAVIAMQYYGSATIGQSPGASWFYITDMGSYYMPYLFNFGGGTAIDATDCFIESVGDPASTVGLKIYIGAATYWILCSSAST